LWLVPHPKSGRPTRRFEHGREAEIVGQVTGVAMRIASTPSKPLVRGSKRDSSPKVDAQKKARPPGKGGLA